MQIKKKKKVKTIILALFWSYVLGFICFYVPETGLAFWLEEHAGHQCTYGMMDVLIYKALMYSQNFSTCFIQTHWKQWQ